MRSAFDANVSRARPRTRLLEIAKEVEGDEAVPADLASVLVRPRGAAGKAKQGRRGAEATARDRGSEAARSAPEPDKAEGAEASVIAPRREPEEARAKVAEPKKAAHEAKLEAQAAPQQVEMPQPEAREAAAKAESPAPEAPEAEAKVEAPASEHREAEAKGEAPEPEPREVAAKVVTPQPAAPETEPKGAIPAASRKKLSERTKAPAREGFAGTEAKAEAQTSVGPGHVPLQRRLADLPLRSDARVPAAAPSPRGGAAGIGARLQEGKKASAPGLSADLASTVRRATGAIRGRISTPGEETVLQGKARIAELRSRLASIPRPPQVGLLAPEQTAATVRGAVESLRARLAEALEERDALASALEASRDELAQANQALAAKDETLAATQRLAEERARVAEELVAEAEALAEERDAALSRLLELKALDDEQGKLLEAAEQAIGERDRLLEEADAQLAALGAQLEEQAVEIESLGAALRERNAERDRLEARIASLEQEVERLQGSQQALAEIQRLVGG